MRGGCVFCEILSGDRECSVVAQDDHAFAFMDIHPMNAGHVLIVPRRHAAALDELSEDEAANTFRLVHRVASALPRSGIPCEAYHVSQVNGSAAGQDVFHAHFHVVPRFENDAVKLVVDPDRPMYTREDLDRFAKQISSVLV